MSVSPRRGRPGQPPGERRQDQGATEAIPRPISDARSRHDRRLTGTRSAVARTASAHADAYYAVPSNRMRLLVNGAIVRAKKRGLPFDEDLRAVLMGSPPKHCACCTVLLDYQWAEERTTRPAVPHR